jgi:lipopolysaccharide/colanic/teichoic acid biosynthesis glycosyltransferase
MMLKRAFDLLVSFLALVILSPVLLGIGLLVRLTSPGPALHRAVRIGRNGVPFTLYKFRSMVSGAEKQGPGITGANDARITPVGRALRRTKLDELPQLYNVLRGDMSLVGPRPEDPHYVAFYTPEQRQVLSVRPGITSQASVDFRHEESLLTGADQEKQYIEVFMPAKLALDLDYVRHVSVWRDLAIIFHTAAALFR